jgi:hypothetical protein
MGFNAEEISIGGSENDNELFFFQSSEDCSSLQSSMVWTESRQAPIRTLEGRTG